MLRDENKISVLKFLEGGQKLPFVIPEYQRPYSWSDDEICTLFDDIWDFSIERKDTDQEYFLGCIVFYREGKVRKIIDGQQRITSLFLLMRAIFHKLENEEIETKEGKYFIEKIKGALWKKDELNGDEDRTKILLTSEVVSDSENDILRKILETGFADTKASDNYSKNYNKFIDLYSKKAEGNSLGIFSFILSLLDYTILLPIEADDQDTALTVFNTLNNRGLELSDADIFKSRIYQSLTDSDRKTEFIDNWKNLDKRASECKESIQSLFYYHLFYLRAKENDTKSTTPGIRKYYLDRNEKRLTAEVIGELEKGLNLWEVVNTRSINENENENERWSLNIDIRKILDCLSSYANEFWKYPVHIFYMQHKDNPDFEELFLKFLRKFYVMLLTRYLETPTINAIKSDILKLNADIINNSHPSFYAGFQEKTFDNEDEVKAEETRKNGLLIKPHPNMVRMMLLLLAYEDKDQKELLPDHWEIEHIFPQKWKEKFYNINENEAEEIKEHIGNKLPLEKKLNITASNGYFDTKKKKYRESRISICQKLAASDLDDWFLDNIKENDLFVCNQLKAVFAKWLNDYDGKQKPTAEEQALINEFRNKGYI